MKYSQKSLIYKVLQTIKENDLILKDDEVIVALSGGADSICLLDALLKLKEKLKINVLACHFNHKLRGKSSESDKKFVQKFCEDRGVECIFGEASAKNMYKNEEEARDARYQFFQKILGERRGAVIAIAHNANDLAETLLARLARGTGIRGLKSIPLSREKFIRPLLYISRNEIETYLKQEKMPFVVDITNKDIRYTRNFIRCKIIPLFCELNPNFIKSTVSMVAILEDDYNLLEKLTAESYQKILISADDKIVLDRRKWLYLSPALKRSTLRFAIEKICGLKDITSKQILEVYEILTKGNGKKQKILPYSLIVKLVSGKIFMYLNDKKEETK